MEMCTLYGDLCGNGIEKGCALRMRATEIEGLIAFEIERRTYLNWCMPECKEILCNQTDAWENVLNENQSLQPDIVLEQ